MGTVLVSLVLAGIVVSIIVNMVKKKKNGCGCGCSGCSGCSDKRN